MAAKNGRNIVYIGLGDQPHSYIEKLLRYLEQTTLKSGGHIKVSHDDWCAFFTGRACNCDPDIREMLPREIVGS